MVNCLGSVVRRRLPVFPIDMKLIKMEREYRQKKIYGEQIVEMKNII